MDVKADRKMAMDDVILTADQLHLLTQDQAWHYRILPISKTGGMFSVYAEENNDLEELRADLEVMFGLDIAFTLLPAGQMARLLAKYYIREQLSDGQSKAGTVSHADDFLMDLIAEAKSLRSSDIHIESYENKCRVRIRIDGRLVERYLLKRDEYPALINKIKIISNLDIAEKRLPQDGRINAKFNEQQMDIRASILPTLHGEKVVLRLLSNDAANIDLNTLGFSSFDLDNYLQGVKSPNGILLISGPTGSGKTTTLYATLKFLNEDTRNILTIEDPVEYTLEGINQVQLKETIGLGFGAALRTFLRQDPDVIMVGEIRDVDTANMAIRAALTGHLVLSTIHTNSAWGTVSRLIDMGVPPFLVASTLNTTVAQRLVRLLCAKCKSPQPFDEKLYPKQFKPYYAVENHFVPRGCEHCYYTGYKGRKAVYEVIPIDKELAIEVKQGNMHIQEALKERSIMTLTENAFDLFGKGLTSIDEIYPLLFNY